MWPVNFSDSIICEKWINQDEKWLYPAIGPNLLTQPVHHILSYPYAGLVSTPINMTLQCRVYLCDIYACSLFFFPSCDNLMIMIGENFRWFPMHGFHWYEQFTSSKGRSDGSIGIWAVCIKQRWYQTGQSGGLDMTISQREGPMFSSALLTL